MKNKKRPDICLTLNCRTVEELKREIDEFGPYCQVIEWCGDEFENLESYSPEEFKQLIKLIKVMCGDKKLSFTMSEAGEQTDVYLRAAMGAADYINIKWENKNAEKLVREAHRNRSKAIVSYHELERILKKEEISMEFIKMEKTGADILGIAAFADKEEDAYELLEGAFAYNQLKGHKTFTAIAMGDEGQASRICCGDFGSSMTFACGSKATAPGQFNAVDHTRYMDVYYK